MGRADEYRRQFAWRSWRAALDALPPLRGQTVLDLGCGVGDLAAELAGRGARVIGIDLDEELLGAARSRGIGGAEFRIADLRELAAHGMEADGLWCSFAAAYFPQLPPVLARWLAGVRAGGWVALTEIDDLFGHEPLGAHARSLLEGYADLALAAGRYDFRMGRKLRASLEACGCTVAAELELPDRELSFAGAAAPEVLDAWRDRFRRMTGLRDACGPELAAVRDELLACLARPDHRSTARVVCCIATRRG